MFASGGKTCADNNQQKSVALSADEFIRRFLLHALPTGTG
jgi:hypothetical protein